MVAPWIQVYSNMIAHPKVHNLAEELKLKCVGVKPNVVAAGLVVSLWCWAAQNATDGNLTGVSINAIADAAGWTKKANIFFDAMVKVGLIDIDGESVWVHDWLEYAWLLHEQTANKKENDRKRSKNYRERKKAAASQQNHGDVPNHRHGDDDVTVTAASQQNHAPTIPNHTIPNHISYEDRRKDIDSATTCDRHSDDAPSALPDWVNDPEYIPTGKEIDALPTADLRMQYTRLRIERMRNRNEQ